MVSASIRLASTAGRWPLTDKALSNTTGTYRLKHMTQKATIAEPTVAVPGEGRMVGNGISRIKTAEPTAGQVEMNLFASSPFRTNAHAITNQQHSDQKFRINRRSTG